MIQNPYRIGTQDNFHMNVGKVVSYNPRNQLHDVNIVGMGRVNVSAMTGGVVKPYPPGTRVVVAKLSTTDWFIFGELPLPAFAPITQANTNDEVLADSRGRAVSSDDIVDILPSYRNFDRAGEPDVPVFEGDVVLQNRDRRNISKSKVIIYAFGDILNFASGFCYTLYHKAKSTLITKARNFYLSCLGYRFEVVTPPDGVENERRTTITETVSSNPLDDSFTIKEAKGSIPEIPYVASNGARTHFGDSFYEVDTDSETIRGSIGDVKFSLGSFKYNTEANPDNGRTDVAVIATGTSGLALKYGATTVLINDVITKIAVDTKVITVSPLGISVEVPGQSIILSDTGLSCNVTSFNVTSAGPVVISGPSIDLNNI